MSATAASKQTRARALFAVAAPFGSWEPLPRDPDVGTFKQSVTEWISEVEQLAKHAGRFSDDFPVELVEGDLHLSEGDEETWRATLDTMRSSLSLLTGAASRAKARDIARLLPDLAPRYLKAHAVLVERTRHMVAFVAFMLGEADEREIQDALLPAAPPAGNARSEREPRPWLVRHASTCGTPRPPRRRSAKRAPAGKRARGQRTPRTGAR